MMLSKGFYLMPINCKSSSGEHRPYLEIPVHERCSLGSTEHPGGKNISERKVIVA